MTDAERDPILLALGRIDGKCDGIDKRLDSIERNDEVVRNQYQGHGERLSGIEMRCGARGSACNKELARLGRKISGLYVLVDAVENTGVHHIAELEGRRAALNSLGRITIGVLSGLGAIGTVAAAIYAIAW